jgi:glycosyltransferase involved in cell wall biosynthesis
MKPKNGRLNILVIPGIIPYPANDGGGKLCVFGLIDYLRKYHTIHVLFSVYTATHKSDLLGLMGEWPDVTFHNVEFYREPKPLSFTGKTIGMVKKAIKGIYYLPQSIIRKKPVTNIHSVYDAYISSSFSSHPGLFIKKLASLIADNKFDIIQTETTPMLNLVNTFPAGVKKVYVQIEGRSDILYDYGVTNNFDPAYIKHVVANTEFLEYAYMKQYDAVFALNETDKIKIHGNLPPYVKVFNSPYGILDADIKELDIDNYKAENIIFTGPESHYPNFDGLNWFLSDVLPKFKHRPFKKFYVTGVWSEETKKRYRELIDCIDFIGFVDDLAPYMRNSVSIVPIRLGGGGIRTKILSAMVYGSAVVATTLSAVGIKGIHQKELLIADTAPDFADAVSRLFDDSKFAQKICKNAYKLIKNEYSQSTVGAIRNNIYHAICDAAFTNKELQTSN